MIGLTGIEIRAGNLTISGGTLKGTMDTYEVTANDNGLTTKGAAVSIAQHTTKQPINVLITGGNFEAKVPLSYTNPLNNSDEDLANITILVTGGVFDTDSGIPIINVVGTRILAGGIFANPVTEFVMDGYVEKPLEGTVVEVVPISDDPILVPDTGAYTRKNDYVATVVSVLAGIAFASVPMYFIITRIKIRKAKVTFTKR